MSDIGGADRFAYPGPPPPVSQHPAYRGIETGSTNPFVPPLPPPRRTAPNSKPGLTSDSIPAQEAYTSASPSRSGRREPLVAGLAGLAGAAAARKIARKPVSGDSPRLQPSDLPEPLSPLEDSPNRYAGYGYGSPISPQGYDHNYDPNRPSFGHMRSASNQPLIGSDDIADSQPSSYTPDRPPTPFGLMGFGATGAAAAAATSPHARDSNTSTSESSHRASNQSNDSYPATFHPTPARSPAHHQSPTNLQPRSARHARFSDPIELPSPTTSSSPHRSSGTSSNNPPPAQLASPLRPPPPPVNNNSSSSSSADSSYRLSSSIPGAWSSTPPRSPRRQSPAYPPISTAAMNMSGGGARGIRDRRNSSQTPPAAAGSHGGSQTGKRLRLSDLRRDEDGPDGYAPGYGDYADHGHAHGYPHDGHDYDGNGHGGSGYGYGHTGYGIGTAM
ncbi:hypothetical protein UCRPC4_g05992 [Phaeomoniella chlamydospora]|uniref:Uncharacterized protein n=1 Tax=Phaeomoniella chlamydospora TaxID=158046 RepID=A0A0G2DZ98_PHACM|nr:hypothetical protein UCRPC4_g05992 [Phaeomoniella chlamydospora]